MDPPIPPGCEGCRGVQARGTLPRLRCRSEAGAPEVGVPASHHREVPIADPRINDQIRISPVLLIDQEGGKVGIVATEQARRQAQDVGLDLVEVAPQARPPVVRIMDWARHRYERRKAAKEARRNQRRVELKEVQLRPRTDDHDFETKLKRARAFLEEGNLVRVVMRFRGRELRRPEVGVATLDRMVAATRDLARVDQRTSNVEGRRLVAILEPQSS